MQLPRADVPNPIAPRTFHFQRGDRVLGHQQLRHPRHRVRSGKEDFLFNMSRWRRTPSNKGNRDKLDDPPASGSSAAREAIEARWLGASRGAENIGPRGGRGGGVSAAAARRSPIYNNVLHDPKMRGSARVHHPVRPARLSDRDQVRQHADQGRASSCIAPRAPFTVAGKQYPAGLVTSSRRRSRSART